LASLVTASVAIAAAPGAVATASRVSSQSELETLVRRISDENGVDPRLVDALVRVESAYDPKAVSRRGALGLMQLMPETARRLDVSDPFDPEQNVRGGIREFARLIRRYTGNLALALAAYNAGEGAVERHRGIPPYAETRNYVARIMTLYTGTPYRLPNYRISPVRMTRDSRGQVVITNQPRSSTGTSARLGSLPQGGVLRGGFGSE
jgi:soluble lytic murein transglycosylase-like protein